MGEASDIGIGGLATTGSSRAPSASDAGHAVALLDLDGEWVQAVAGVGR